MRPQFSKLFVFVRVLRRRDNGLNPLQATGRLPHDCGGRQHSRLYLELVGEGLGLRFLHLARCGEGQGVGKGELHLSLGVVLDGHLVIKSVVGVFEYLA